MSNLAPHVRARVDAIGRARFGADWMARDIVQAPGRIELIGNHLDYNGGPVLAAAIDRGIAVARSWPASHDGIRAVFADLDDATIHEIDPPWSQDWQSTLAKPAPIDYLRGVITAATRRGYQIRSGSDLVIAGDLPHGIGISSSAALCVALTIAVTGDGPSSDELVLIAQEAEHRVGSPCGTMDQSASVYGGLIEYDGATGNVAPVRSNLDGFRLLVVNSGVVRSLATSAYPERVQETGRALQLLRERWRPGLTSLAAIEYRDLPDVLEALVVSGEPLLANRVRHVVSETDRVQRAVDSILRSDWHMVGQLMSESGRSSATDYDISHPAVEQIVTICLAQRGVLGARMMGGGQGGSVLVLVADDAEPALKDRLGAEYFDQLVDGAPTVQTLTCTFAVGAGPVVSRQAS